MSWQRLSRPAATFSCSTMALFTKPKRSCWPIILSPSSSRLTHPNSILLSGSGVTSKINWRVTCLPPWRNFLSRWLKLSLGIQPLTYAHLQRSLTSSRLLSQLMYTNHKETVLPLMERIEMISRGRKRRSRAFPSNDRGRQKRNDKVGVWIKDTTSMKCVYRFSDFTSSPTSDRGEKKCNV